MPEYTLPPSTGARYFEVMFGQQFILIISKLTMFVVPQAAWTTFKNKLFEFWDL